MDEIKQQFKKDFEDANKVELSFDTDQLEANSKKTRHKVKPYKKGLIIFVSTMATLFLVVAIPASIFLASSLKSQESVKLRKRNYTINEINVAQANTFEKLNNVYYANAEHPTQTELTAEEKTAYNSFSNTTYHSLVDTSKKDNMSYSAIGLYSLINEMSEAASREELKGRFNMLLGLNKDSRLSFYGKVLKANSFARESATIQLRNGAFFHNKYQYSPSYVDYLTSLSCEAYRLDFSKDADKIVEWVNEAVNSRGFIDKDFLEMDSETQLYLFSTLYFKNAWANKYLSKDNVKDDFYLANGETVKADYMNHSYMVESYYDYESYIAVKDYYYGGYASVTYLVPKKTNDDIFELTKDVNIFEDKESNKVTPSEEHERIKVNFKTPKFSLKADIDFKKCLSNLGFADIFNPTIDSFKNAFQDENLTSYNIYAQKIKQRNEVEFNEDGSVVKSVTLGGFAGKSAAPNRQMDALDVNLNQPFIYIIRDVNETPIFVGHVDNPTKA